MAAEPSREQQSPWRRIFEEVRHAVGNRRDEDGVLGSINWLRKQMEARGANPNVVRNIIYRDKGKLDDKQVLFEILTQLWETTGRPPLQAPELEALLSPSSTAEQEVLQLLGREKRRAYRTFVGGVRSGANPKLLISGRPGSGKTLLTDYVQQALELPPRAADDIVRLEFSSADLAASLTQLASALDVPAEQFQAKLVKVGTSGAFAVQADHQADVARIILDTVKQRRRSLVLLLHVSQSLAGEDRLGTAPLRLNTPEVPRVSASEWLWLSLLEPLARLPHVSMLVSMTDVPARILQHLGAFEGPIKLNPPTVAEARRFVKARLPHLSSSQQEAVVQRAGRSFEELRTLTLLAEVREAVPQRGADAEPDTRHIEQLGQLVITTSDHRLRAFLTALAVLSIPEFPTFQRHALTALRDRAFDHGGTAANGELSSLELAFLDAVPGKTDSYRSFSRQFARTLRRALQQGRPGQYRARNRDAAELYRAEAEDDPKSEAAARYLHHLFEARAWEGLIAWLQRATIQQSLVHRLWRAAITEIVDRDTLEAVALQVASHYVKLGSYGHPDAVAAFEVLNGSSKPAVQAWTSLKQAEGAVISGHFDRAEALLATCPPTDDPLLNAESALVAASIARWHSDLERAAALVEESARPHLAAIDPSDSAGSLAHAKVAVWAGLIHKDRGDLESALAEFSSVRSDDDLITARVAFQRGDVLMQLGRFDEALAALDEAVRLSHRSEALVQEQMRYLARRGTLYLRRHDLQSARDDFEAARTILGDATVNGDPTDAVEGAFWAAKLDDERALLLLAEGRCPEAIFLLERNLRAFDRYAATFAVDANYRILRTTLRLGTAYGCRGSGMRLPRPFGLAARQLPPSLTGDLAHANALLHEVVDTIEAQPDRQHFGALYRQALLAASLFAPNPSDAEALARASLEVARFPYQQAESQALLALALLRGGQSEAAREVVSAAAGHLRTALRHAADGERGDLALQAWLVELELQALVGCGDASTAAERLAEALEQAALRPHHEVLLRSYGEAIDGIEGRWLRHPKLQRILHAAEDNRLLRLPDALVAGWQQYEAASMAGSP